MGRVIMVVSQSNTKLPTAPSVRWVRQKDPVETALGAVAAHTSVAPPPSQIYQEGVCRHRAWIAKVQLSVSGMFTTSTSSFLRVASNG